MYHYAMQRANVNVVADEGKNQQSYNNNNYNGKYLKERQRQ